MRDVTASNEAGSAPRRLWKLVATTSLFLLVFGTSISLGGAIYSSQVVEGLWSADPPQSVAQWYPVMSRAGSHFWSRVTPTVGVLALLTLATSFGMNARQRDWRILAAVVFLSVLVWSFVYFAPTVAALGAAASTGSDPEAVVEGVQTWVRLDTWRMLLVLLAWLCAIRALTLRSAG